MKAFIVTISCVFHTAKVRLKSDENGATMVEYGFMVAFITVVVMAVVITLGPQIALFFTPVSNAL